MCVCPCPLTDLKSNFPCTTSFPVTGIGGGRGWLASTKSWAGGRGWGWGAAGCTPNDPAPPMCNEPGLGACVKFRQVQISDVQVTTVRCEISPKVYQVSCMLSHTQTCSFVPSLRASRQETV